MTDEQRKHGYIELDKLSDRVRDICSWAAEQQRRKVSDAEQAYFVGFRDGLLFLLDGVTPDTEPAPPPDDPCPPTLRNVDLPERD